ncbi:Phosphoribosyl 1,2-cyclic phosphodiesterase [Fodinibius salinus]|uniref:Phosphoribosyl 1,2-cyclic phosphodiesterase n=1 Tax=Fodinibius salinus TaxID=860790 RepID=A0A5D3YMQ0_9BACT|nr:MBL fold metallo-hydrolase [Fodinibius salinus]TYP93971.1 Phosphoribosyl 1,2-cyclic phosphodiesterase [Fodinibius salinus]
MGERDERIALTFWGVRGSTPCANSENMEYGGNTTCIQLRIPKSDEVVVLDSGTGIRNLGNKLVKHSGNISGRIFITHPHWDHIQGFPFFKPIYDSDNDFTIHMPKQGDMGCKEILSGHLTKTFFPVTLEMIDANLEYITQLSAPEEYDGYTVEFMKAKHTVDTAAYKIHVDGSTIVFCPDNELKEGTSFFNEFKLFCQDADVLIHDGQYNRQMYKNRHGWGHSAWEIVADFARKAGVRNLFITHHDPDSTDYELATLDKKLHSQFGRDFESIQLAKEGAKILI